MRQDIIAQNMHTIWNLSSFGVHRFIEGLVDNYDLTAEEADELETKIKEMVDENEEAIERRNKKRTSIPGRSTMNYSDYKEEFQQSEQLAFQERQQIQNIY